MSQRKADYSLVCAELLHGRVFKWNAGAANFNEKSALAGV